MGKKIISVTPTIFTKNFKEMILLFKALTFLNNRKGTPSIETVAIIAFIALAIFTNLDTIGGAIGSVFDFVGDNLTDQIAE